MTPQEWADKLVDEAWKPLLETVDIANDDFIRTTEERHEANVQKFLQKLYDDGHIYTGEYEGYYCVGCEEYKQQSELVDGTGEYEGQLVCAIHSKPVELLHEKNYFFRMSAFAGQAARRSTRSGPDFVQPESARNEVVRFVKQGLADLSISRSTFDWGMKVPWDESHVVYVWFDALLNYITAVGYGEDDEEFARRWPAQHLVGKDILRFHAVIWPAMLMAAGLEVPTRRVRCTAGCSSAARRCRSRSSPASRRRRSPTPSAPTRSGSTSSRRSTSARTARSRGRTSRPATRPSSPTGSATSPRASSR